MASVESREFLASCLRAALEDPDLVDAIADTAIEEGLNAAEIAKGSVSIDRLKDLLFLTSDEAQLFYNVCSAMVKEDGANRDEPLSLKLTASKSGQLSLRLKLKELPLPMRVSVPQASVASSAAAAAPAAPMPDKALDVPAVPEGPVHGPAMPTEDLAGSASGEGDGPEVDAPMPCALTQAEEPEVEQPAAEPSQPVTVETPSDAEAPLVEPVPMPAQLDSSAIVMVSRTTPSPSMKKLDSESPAPALSAMLLTPMVPEAAELQTPFSNGSHPQPPKPSPSPASASRPKTAIPKPAGLALPYESSAPTILGSTSPALLCSSASTPSYLRPTAAHRARTAKEDSPATPPLPPVPEEHKPRRRRGLFERVASTFLAPTQAFVARITNRAEEAKAKKQTSVTRTSLQLEAMLGSPAGQRVTKPQPFALASDTRSRSASCMLTTEELRLAEAREKTWRRSPVPKHVHEQRPIVPVVRSEPKNPEAVFKPFNLVSLELHNKKAEEKRKKEEAAAKAEEEARQFRARAFDPRLAAGPISPRKPSPAPPTRGVAPVFASEARIAHYHEVVEPVKKAKEAEANREKLEAERKAKELEEMSVQDFRKTLEFKARTMPDFSAPFRPDLSQARPVTSASEFELHTDKRLGAAPSPGARQDKEGPGLGNGVYDGAGYVDPFFASLRKSTSVVMGRTGAASSTVAARRSVAVRQSAAATYGRSAAVGSPGMRGSVGTALQAAIRAAARDAANELKSASPGNCGANSRRNKAGDKVGSPAIAAAN